MVGAGGILICDKLVGLSFLITWIPGFCIIGLAVVVIELGLVPELGEVGETAVVNVVEFLVDMF